ncbi:MAG: hypothetical protein RRZ65_10365 [Tannerellaceae bacterium]
MTVIANPIYDAVFKFMMEDDKVARLLLSALLKKEILELEMRQQEFTKMNKNRISLFRMDFAAKIRDDDGTEHLVLIELQKTWLATETLRFRQYLGTQYLSPRNMRTGDESEYGLPIISIYILGHLLGDLMEPVVYVRRQYLDYDDKVIEQKDPFIESLTHDSIIVQIPHLQGRTRTRLERLLNVFDQEYRIKGDDHLLEIDETQFPPDEMRIVIRLLSACSAPEVRQEMDIEDQILSEIEARDTAIMQRDQQIVKRDQVIVQKDQVIVQKEQVIEQKEQVIEQKEQVIEQKEQVIEQSKQELEQSKQELVQSKQMIEQKECELEQHRLLVKKIVCMLSAEGKSAEDIAKELSLSVSQVEAYLQSY